MRRVTTSSLVAALVALLVGAPAAHAQCVKNQGDMTAELLVNGGNSDGSFTYVWGITFDDPTAWLTNIWFQSSGNPVTSPVVIPEYTTWTHAQVASAPGTGMPAQLFTFQSGFKLQKSRTFTFAYTTDFTDPVQVRALANTGAVNTVSFNSATCGNLPVELTSFEVRANGGTVLALWETASETNNAGFTVEMSLAGADGYTALGFVAGVGTTLEAQRYRFETGVLAPGRYSFRLRQVDFDGAFEYSDPVELEIAAEGPVHVRPFPSAIRGTTQIAFSVARADQVQVQLFNVLGQQVARLYAGAVAAGETVTATLDVASLPAGAYFLRLQGTTFQRTERVTVVH